MHGDFTRDTFDPARQFTRVLHQQGRLVVDADANEQSAILLGYLRQLGADLIGWHGGAGVTKNGTAPDKGPFVVSATAADKVVVTGGSYYVDGIRVTANKPTTEPIPRTDNVADKAQVVYLDVWERHVTGWEEPALLDLALGGLDTTTRTELRAAVKILRVPETEGIAFFKGLDNASATQDKLRGSQPIDLGGNKTASVLDTRLLTAPALPKLAAWTVDGRDPVPAPAPTGGVTLAAPVDDDCDGVTRGGFAGLENQLYRVEVHAGGVIDVKVDDKSKVTSMTPLAGVTVKWSRDNGSVVYPFNDLGVSGDTCTLTLAAWWRDDGRKIKTDDWVEVMAAAADRGVFLRVSAEPSERGRQLTLATQHLSPVGKAELAALATAKPNSGLLRRWDHQAGKLTDGAVELALDADASKEDVFAFQSFKLEDGLMVRLALPKPKLITDGPDADKGKLVEPRNIAEFRPGDYWLIPARAATGDVLWKLDANGKAAWEPARYTEHHYAPLAIIAANGTDITDLRQKITQAAPPM